MRRPISAIGRYCSLIPGLGVKRLGASSLNYPEALASIRRGRHRRNRLSCQCRVDKGADGPSPISNANGLRWRRLKGLMDAAEIVMGDAQRDRRNMIVNLL